MKIIVLDTETGGLEPDGTALTAIGALAMRLEGARLLPLEGHEKIAEFEAHIAPCKSLRLTDKALEVQRLTREEVYDSNARISEAQALTDLSAWLSEVGFEAGDWPIWAHNAEFDRNHLGAAIRRRVKTGYLAELCGRDSLWGCTCYEARNSAALRCIERPKGDGGAIRPGFTLDACCCHFGISLESRAVGHGALVDAKLCARLLSKLVSAGGRV